MLVGAALIASSTNMNSFPISSLCVSCGAESTEGSGGQLKSSGSTGRSNSSSSSEVGAGGSGSGTGRGSGAGRGVLTAADDDVACSGARGGWNDDAEDLNFQPEGSLLVMSSLCRSLPFVLTTCGPRWTGSRGSGGDWRNGSSSGRLKVQNVWKSLAVNMRDLKKAHDCLVFAIVQQPNNMSRGLTFAAASSMTILYCLSGFIHCTNRLRISDGYPQNEYQNQPAQGTKLTQRSKSSLRELILSSNIEG